MADEKKADEKATAEDARAKAAQAEKARVAHTGAQEGAQSVAEAVKRVADAAVAEVQKVKAGPPADLYASGTAGGRVNIVGTYFGPSGTVKLNGVQVNTREWSTTRIVGDLPADAKSGPLEVHVDDKTVKTGYLTL